MVVGIAEQSVFILPSRRLGNVLRKIKDGSLYSYRVTRQAIKSTTMVVVKISKHSGSIGVWKSEIAFFALSFGYHAGSVS